MSSRFFKFFASRKGRKYVFIGTTIASVSSFVINYLPHNLLIDQYREILASYQNGVERPVSEALMRKFEKAAALVKLTDAERNVFEPFIVSGFDLFSIGSTKFRNGAYVGVPINYAYTAADEIPRTEITVKGYDQVDWSSKGGELLQEALILTENEQVFGIAREMMELRTHDVTINSLLASGAIVSYYSFTNGINQKNQLYGRPLSVRIVLYTLAGLFIGGSYCLMKDMSRVYTERETDAALSNLDKEYVEAGVGFYDKILKKNMAIRHLTGSNQFTALGNINDYLRTVTTPLTQRKAFFEKKLKELSKEAEARNEIEA